MHNTNNIFSIESPSDFNAVCMDIFYFQAANCEPYRTYLNALGVSISSITKPCDIPFLPIQLFKAKKVYASTKAEDVIFTSSSTTGVGISSHHVADVKLYEQSFLKGFELFYGKPNKYAILALLPSYLERSGSSLIYMVESLIRHSQSADSGFCLHNHSELHSKLLELKVKGKPTILIGVSFALLDFVEQYPISFPELVVMETGGMKGRKKEMVRKELHSILYKGFGVTAIHSEYGMTECLSQAYSSGYGRYHCPPWMKVVIRDSYDPLSPLDSNAVGGVNIIDLANLYSCSFIETQDLGKSYDDGSFEILGRFDSSDIRGCNLMV